MATKTKAPTEAAPKVTAATVDADGFAIIDPKAIKPAYDPKAPRPWKLHCSTCQKPVWRASRAPDTCYACDRTAAQAAAQPRKATKRQQVMAEKILNAGDAAKAKASKVKVAKKA
jgi:hypothetical protein